MGRGYEQLRMCRQTRRPLRPVTPTAKIPLFFHRKCGPLLWIEEQWGGPQEMAFVWDTASWFWVDLRCGAGARQAFPGATCPTLEISGQVHSVPGVVTFELHAGPATQRTVPFPKGYSSQQVSHPCRGRVSGEELGSWVLTGRRPQLGAAWSWPGWTGTSPKDGFSSVESGLCSAWAAESLSLAETPPRCLESANCIEWLQLCKVCAKPPRKEV